MKLKIFFPNCPPRGRNDRGARKVFLFLFGGEQGAIATPCLGGKRRMFEKDLLQPSFRGLRLFRQTACDCGQLGSLLYPPLECAPCDPANLCLQKWAKITIRRSSATQQTQKKTPKSRLTTFAISHHMAGSKRVPRWTCEMSATLLSLACAGTGGRVVRIILYGRVWPR